MAIKGGRGISSLGIWGLDFRPKRLPVNSDFHGCVALMSTSKRNETDRDNLTGRYRTVLPFSTSIRY